MPALDRQRDPGEWTLSSPVEPEEFEAIDEARPLTINSSGGAWALDAPIETSGFPIRSTFPALDQSDLINKAYFDAQADIAARACLNEQKGTINAIWASAPCIAWDEASNAFFTVDSTHDLNFFSGANTSANDGALPTSTTGTSTNIRISANDAGSVWLARGASVSTGARLSRWLRSTGSWANVTGAFPSGTVLPFVQWVTGTTFLAFDGSNCYEINGIVSTARTSPGISPTFGASNGTITVVASNGTPGSVKTTANNGVSWSSVTGFTDDAVAITWFPRLQKFVMTGEGGSFIRLSADGVTWDGAGIVRKQQRGITNIAPQSLAPTAGGRMLVGHIAATGSGEYANTYSLMYSYDAVTWRTWDMRNSGGAPIGVATSDSQVAVLYPSGAARLFGAG